MRPTIALSTADIVADITGDIARDIDCHASIKNYQKSLIAVKEIFT